MAKSLEAATPPAQPKRIVLERTSDESPAQWERTLTAIAAAGSATVTLQADGSALIEWPRGVSE